MWSLGDIRERSRIAARLRGVRVLALLPHQRPVLPPKGGLTWPSLTRCLSRGLSTCH
jgi:hypothetical protein